MFLYNKKQNVYCLNFETLPGRLLGIISSTGLFFGGIISKLNFGLLMVKEQMASGEWV